jgi:catechol 2,3-dioxygenase-like lactoylglutathione lyase family enzyme
MATARDEVLSEEAIGSSQAARIDTKLEVIVISVSDVDRAREFYARLGWRLDADFDNGKDFRVLQFTPPGSGCSVVFGKNVTVAAPGSTQGLLVVSDIEAAHAELVARSVGVSDVFHCAKGFGCRFPGRDGRVSGPHPERLSYGSFLSFSDPDGNGWQFQEVLRAFLGALSARRHTRRPPISPLRSGVRR